MVDANHYCSEKWYLYEEEYRVNGETPLYIEVQDHRAPHNWMCFDATRAYGTPSRHVNHATTPNVGVMVALVDGVLRIALVALEDVREGEELLLDYSNQPHPPRWIQEECLVINYYAVSVIDKVYFSPQEPRQECGEYYSFNVIIIAIM